MASGVTKGAKKDISGKSAEIANAERVSSGAKKSSGGEVKLRASNKSGTVPGNKNSSKPSAKLNLKSGSKLSANATTKPANKVKASTTDKPAGKVITKSTDKPANKVTAKSTDKPATRVTANATNKPATKSSTKHKSNLGKDAQKKSGDIDERFVASSKPDINAMMKRLCQLYPDAHCELNFATTFQLLTSVIMSAQTTDVGVNKVTPILFKRFPDAKALAEADIEEIKQIIKPTGYYNSKATNIQRCAQALVERFGGVVPQTLEELTSLPGVGRKTANVVLGVAFGKPGWTVDTHVQRLVRRLGFTAETDPVMIEFSLQKVFPGQDWSQYSITLIWHGRRLCYARKPDCGACPVNNLCPSSLV